MTPTPESALEKVHCWLDCAYDANGGRLYTDAEVAAARAELYELHDRLIAYTNSMRAKDKYIDTLDAWILEHAQHGAACRVPLAEGHPCTCGLGKIMEEMS